jgi:hypothetical protein
MGDDEKGNWLATLGGWLFTPLKAIFRPWWDNLVEKKAASEAVRSQVLSAITRFRIIDFQRVLNRPEPDRVLGLTDVVLSRIGHFASMATSGPFPPPKVVHEIEREIQLHAVGLTTWIQLACLSSVGGFAPHSFVMVDFTDEKGSRVRAFSAIASLQSSFPFTNIIQVSETETMLSQDATSLLDEFCSRKPMPEVLYWISLEPPRPGQAVESSPAERIPRGWSPMAEAVRPE